MSLALLLTPSTAARSIIVGHTLLKDCRHERPPKRTRSKNGLYRRLAGDIEQDSISPAAANRCTERCRSRVARAGTSGTSRGVAQPARRDTAALLITIRWGQNSFKRIRLRYFWFCFHRYSETQMSLTPLIDATCAAGNTGCLCDRCQVAMRSVTTSTKL